MNTTDSIAFAGLVIATVSTIISAIYSYRNYKNTQGQLESDMYEKLANLERDLVQCKTGEEFNEGVYENIQESICNRYEIYCLNYLKGRIDKKAFEEMYFDNLISIYTNPDYNVFFGETSTYNYSNIYKVVKKIRDRE
ncbi:hypothetical protein PT158_08225 [Erysipelothrix rhusiopathiae]|nr:hypothetical protein [Erysipelothrix rhusiopathiae]MDE8323502.1 hypothetical protein [Erysipelothrix rhusiopathiae]